VYSKNSTTTINKQLSSELPILLQQEKQKLLPCGNDKKYPSKEENKHTSTGP